MAITQSMTTSFKVGLLNGDFDFGTGTSQQFWIALYTSSADLGAATTAYSTSNEVPNGSGYTTGGQQLTVSVVPTASGTTAYLDFDDVTWTSATISAAGALIYHKNGTTNPSVAVLSFGGTKSSSSGNFTIQMPTADASNAIIRIA